MSDAVITQLIVLASVLSGFGLSIAANIALNKEHHPNHKRIALYLIGSSLASVGSVIVGALTIATPVAHRWIAHSLFIVSLLALGIASFLLAIVSMVEMIHPGGLRRVARSVFQLTVLSNVAVFVAVVAQAFQDPPTRGIDEILELIRNLFDFVRQRFT